MKTEDEIKAEARLAYIRGTVDGHHVAYARAYKCAARGYRSRGWSDNEARTEAETIANSIQIDTI